MKPCYLDHNAGEPMSRDVVEAIHSMNRLPYGNPNSLHQLGLRSKQLIDEARTFIARAIGAKPSHILFTNGGSDANQRALQGIIESTHRRGRSANIVYGATEHPSVLGAIEQHERNGFCKGHKVRVHRNGQPDLSDLQNKLSGADALFLMAANNETGVLLDVDAVATLVEAAECPWHCDMVQVLGKLPIDLGSHAARAISSASISAHKIAGPAGIGALIFCNQSNKQSDRSPSLSVQPTIGATANLLGMMGFYEASKGIKRRLQHMEAVRLMRDELERMILDRFPDATIHGSETSRLPNTTAVSIRRPQGSWIDGEETVIDLAHAGFCVSTGAACSTGSSEPSHVLLAMEIPPIQASASLRISLGINTKRDDLHRLLQALEPLF
jgi:cysteine desulfurase